MNESTSSRDALAVFISYSHCDEAFREELATHLIPLERDGLITTWHDRKITPGDEWEGRIDERLTSADIILLLISPDFIASKYCYDIEMKAAISQHHRGATRVIPIIVRSVDWTNSPFAFLTALPTDGTPITSPQWPDRDVAFTDVVIGIRRALSRIRRRSLPETNDLPEAQSDPASIKSNAPAATDQAFIELTIDRDFDSFTERQQDLLLEAIKNVLQANSTVNIVQRRRGSVKLLLQMPTGDAEKLLSAIRSGKLDEFGVSRGTYEEPAGLRQSRGSIEGISRFRERLIRIVEFRMDPRVRGRFDAEDVVQEAILEAWTRRKTDYAGDSDEDLFLWLRFLSWQKLSQYHRIHIQASKRTVIREKPLDAPGWTTSSGQAIREHLMSHEMDPSEQLDRKERRDALHACLDQMDPIDRELIALRHFEQLSNSETAKLLNLDEDAVRKRRYRALKRLGEILSRG